jgi:hypothetical protein
MEYLNRFYLNANSFSTHSFEAEQQQEPCQAGSAPHKTPRHSMGGDRGKLSAWNSFTAKALYIS